MNFLAVETRRATVGIYTKGSARYRRRPDSQVTFFLLLAVMNRRPIDQLAIDVD